MKRIPEFEEGDVNCLGCGRTIHLYYNGGELDRQECCGYVYETECLQIDLVISKKDPQAGAG